MKRVGNLFETIISDENLGLALREVNRTHRWCSDHQPNRCTLWVEKTFVERREELKEILINGFEPSPARRIDKYDANARKWRNISEPRQWPDQYVHHALVQAIQPVCMRGMDPFCCGSIRERGIHYGKRAIERWMRGDKKGTRYVLSADVYHFYDSLDPELVMDRFRNLIKDHRTLGLLWSVIRDGIKVGFYPSQWVANTFLQPMDVMIREDEATKHYIRYMDNITIFAANKRKLRKLKSKIEQWLNDHGLKLKGDWQIYATDDRLPDALGYRYGHDFTLPRKLSYFKLKRSIAKYRRRRDAGKRISVNMAAGILSRLGQLKHCNNYNLYKALFKGERLQHELKRIVRHAPPLETWTSAYIRLMT